MATHEEFCFAMLENVPDILNTFGKNGFCLVDEVFKYVVEFIPSM